jgi:hypothetical protein
LGRRIVVDGAGFGWFPIGVDSIGAEIDFSLAKQLNTLLSVLLSFSLMTTF